LIKKSGIGSCADSPCCFSFYRQVAKQIIRNQDRLYRYGGDEFCILIPGTAASGATKLGERLIQQLSETRVEVEGQRLCMSCARPELRYWTAEDSFQ